jgi:hypothetical protein
MINGTNYVIFGTYSQADRDFLPDVLQSWDLAGQVTNTYGVENEETRFHPEVFLCRGMRKPWPEIWSDLQSLG